jgi:hypothetical protein
VLGRTVSASVAMSATDVDEGGTVAVGEQAVRPRAVTITRVGAAVPLPDIAPRAQQWHQLGRGHSAVRGDVAAPINACPTAWSVSSVVPAPCAGAETTMTAASMAAPVAKMRETFITPSPSVYAERLDMTASLCARTSQARERRQESSLYRDLIVTCGWPTFDADVRWIAVRPAGCPPSAWVMRVSDTTLMTSGPCQVGGTTHP